MTRTSVLADALKAIVNAEKTGKRQVLIRPSSKVIIKFLQVMQRHGMLNLRVFESRSRYQFPGLITRWFVKCGSIFQWHTVF